MQHALENWPSSAESLRQQGKTGPYFYQQGVYQQLGLA
jgi:hypothetical protein